MVTAKSNAEKILASRNNKEALAVYNIQKKYNKGKNNALYIPLEQADINWKWTPNEVSHFDWLWKTGVSLMDIAEKLSRPPVEIVIMIIDRELRGKLKPRKGGFYGF